uniref:Uncharacterized protein n=1 Tax=Tanacetum cinerariifolium TaxID=118510 RepID=A0A699H9X6_TANCI|nr:hypothetical protein [Tanacetum cinerariifolium]GEX69365.1 hypothetical protein [Tanacetum cinerariifolium]
MEAHYLYMAKIQEVIQAADEDTRPIYDTEPLEKVHENDVYNVFSNKREHLEQPESNNDTYVVEKADRIITPNSSDIRFPAQSIISSNVIALDSPYLLVLITEMSQSRQRGKSESDSYYLSD